MVKSEVPIVFEGEKDFRVGLGFTEGCYMSFNSKNSKLVVGKYIRCVIRDYHVTYRQNRFMFGMMALIFFLS